MPTHIPKIASKPSGLPSSAATDVTELVCAAVRISTDGEAVLKAFEVRSLGPRGSGVLAKRADVSKHRILESGLVYSN